MLKQEIRRGHP